MYRGLHRFIAVVCLVSALNGQMRPDAPIQNFRFPVFGENGYRLWELRGVEGRYLSEDESLIFGLDLRAFSGDAAMQLENRIRSPEARIHFPNATAQGESTLFVTGPNYEIAGTNWKWEGKAKRMTVTGGSRVVFFDTITILK